MDFFTLFFFPRKTSSFTGILVPWGEICDANRFQRCSVTSHTTGTGWDTGFWDNANRKLCVEDPPSKDSIFQCTSVWGGNLKHMLQRFDFQRPGKHQRVPQEYVSLSPEASVLKTKRHDKTQLKSALLH